MTARQQRRAAGTRERLLVAAHDLFAENGYVATTVDAIVDKARSSKGSFYHHYESKESLFLALVRERWAKQQRGMDEQLSEMVALPANLAELAVVTLQFLVGPGEQAVWGPVYLEFWAAAHRNHKVQAEVAELLRDWQEFLAGTVMQLQAAGMIDVSLPPEAVASFLINCFYGYLMHSLLQPGATSPEQVALFIQRALAGNV